jgi:DNA-directed RNA polymerase specialized sigma24 family protein
LDLPISTEDLTRLYRFALLLTGDEGAAQQVLYDACADSAARLGTYRNEDQQVACLMGAIRQKAKPAPVPATADSRAIVRAFATLPEAERVALAGIYTGLLPARLLAEALKMSLVEMGRALKSGRDRLERAGLQMGEPTLEQAL